tara:strand:+ start:528 stop:1067 length:540 start_codon:yes stop_codon:yes gene_type:complete
MKVKIGIKIHDAELEPIMLILTEKDKRNIKNMDNTSSLYCTFPDDLHSDEIYEFTQNWISEKGGISLEKKDIDKVTTSRLDMALRMVGVSLNMSLIDKIIDLVEVIEDKGDDVSLKDIVKLQEQWEAFNGLKIHKDDQLFKYDIRNTIQWCLNHVNKGKDGEEKKALVEHLKGLGAFDK